MVYGRSAIPPSKDLASQSRNGEARRGSEGKPTEPLSFPVPPDRTLTAAYRNETESPTPRQRRQEVPAASSAAGRRFRWGVPRRRKRNGGRDLSKRSSGGFDPRSLCRAPHQPTRGGVAQLGEQLLCKHQVVGSTPIASTTTFPTAPRGAVAQSVERRSEKAEVAGSIPAGPTTPSTVSPGVIAQLGRALRSQRRGRGFDPPWLHHLPRSAGARGGTAHHRNRRRRRRRNGPWTTRPPI